MNSLALTDFYETLEQLERYGLESSEDTLGVVALGGDDSPRLEKAFLDDALMNFNGDLSTKDSAALYSSPHNSTPPIGSASFIYVRTIAVLGHASTREGGQQAAVALDSGKQRRSVQLGKSL